MVQNIKLVRLNMLFLDYKNTKNQKSFNYFYEDMKKICINHLNRTKDTYLLNDGTYLFDDIFHETMIKVLRNIDNFDPRKSSIISYFLTAFLRKLSDVKKMKFNMKVNEDPRKFIHLEI